MKRRDSIKSTFWFCFLKEKIQFLFYEFSLLTNQALIEKLNYVLACYSESLSKLSIPFNPLLHFCCIFKTTPFQSFILHTTSLTKNNIKQISITVESRLNDRNYKSMYIFHFQYKIKICIFYKMSDLNPTIISYNVTFLTDFFSLTSYLLFVRSGSHIPGKQHCNHNNNIIRRNQFIIHIN